MKQKQRLSTMSTSTTQFAIRLVLVTVVAGLLAGCSLLRPRMIDPVEYAVTVEAVRLQPVETLALWQWPTATPIPTTAQATATAMPIVTFAADLTHFLPVVAAPHPVATSDAAMPPLTVDAARLSVVQWHEAEVPACRYVATATPMPKLIGSTIPPLPPISPLSPAEAAGCDCSGYLYTCADFESVGAAQVCFEHCKEQGRGDIHRLDEDNDRLACYRSEAY